MFIAALLTIAKVWNQPKRPLIEEWIKKMFYIYTQNELLLSHKNDTFPFATTWMDLGCIMVK